MQQLWILFVGVQFLWICIQNELKITLLCIEADMPYLDDEEIIARTNFPESWFWTNMVLPSCPGNDPNW